MDMQGGRPKMGRGRARAKQTRVARDLKYRSFDTDFESLQRELRGDHDEVEPEEEYDPYSELAEKYNSYYDDDIEEEPEK